jgi:hypothetical protein
MYNISQILQLLRSWGWPKSDKKYVVLINVWIYWISCNKTVHNYNIREMEINIKEVDLNKIFCDLPIFLTSD